MIRCILALDLKGGIVVHGVRGERDLYRPIHEYSRIVSTSDPFDVIRSLKPNETYVADLDRITGTGDNLPAIARISRLTDTIVDAGIAGQQDAAEVRRAAGRIILGTETATILLIEALQGDDAIVSVDMRHGQMMAADPALRESPLDVVKKLNSLDLGGIILLDVARVGSGEGVDLELLRQAVSTSRHPVIVGGGVRDVQDLERIERSGAAGAIVASAVHAGSIPSGFLR